MTDELKHECAVAMVVLRKPPCATGDFGGTKLSLLLEKQHNRGQDGAGAAILSADPAPGSLPYWIAKSASATPLADVLGMIGKRKQDRTSDNGPQTSATEVLRPKSEVERIFIGHLRYATFGKNDVAYCHPFVHEASDLRHTLLLAGNFNLTNAGELFDDYSHAGAFPTSKSDGYLICELIAHELKSYGRAEMENESRDNSVEHAEHVEKGCDASLHVSTRLKSNLPDAISTALENADGAWTLCGMTADGWAFATRDPHGIRPGFYYIDEDVVVVASERPAIQAAFDVPPEAVKELPPGEVLVVSPQGDVEFVDLNSRSSNQTIRRTPCAFERIYFSRANDADIHRERKALGAALVPAILSAADAPLEDIFFSYIPNSARIAFHGLLEELFGRVLTLRTSDSGLRTAVAEVGSPKSEVSNLCVNKLPRFGEIAVKDAKFRTFIADAAARREFYKHVYDVTYGLVRPGKDTLVVLDDSIVRGNTMKNAILPMLDRLGPKRIVIASSAPPIRYPDCYGIDMSTLGELVAFKALVNLLGSDADKLLKEVGVKSSSSRKDVENSTLRPPLKTPTTPNPLAPLYARFTEKEHAAEIARLLTPPGMKAEVVVVYQTVEDLRRCIGVRAYDMRQPANAGITSQPTALNSQLPIGDWYFTGDYPTPGGYKVLHKAILNYLDKSSERSY